MLSLRTTNKLICKNINRCAKHYVNYWPCISRKYFCWKKYISFIFKINDTFVSFQCLHTMIITFFFITALQVQHLQKVLAKKRDPVTHVCFMDELAKVRLAWQEIIAHTLSKIHNLIFLRVNPIIIIHLMPPTSPPHRCILIIVFVYFQWHITNDLIYWICLYFFRMVKEASWEYFGMQQQKY